MKKSFLQFLAASALTAMLSTASAAVLTFDDLPDAGVNAAGYFIANYHGFQFGNNDGATNPWFFATEAHQDGLYFGHSGPNLVGADELTRGDFFNGTTTAPISRDTPFIFDGAWFSGYETLGFDLYDGDTLVFASTPVALTVASAFIPSGYSGAITSIVFVEPEKFSLGDFALDDLTYEDLAVAAVPEPDSLALIVVGTIVLASTVRRRRVPTRNKRSMKAVLLAVFAGGLLSNAAFAATIATGPFTPSSTTPFIVPITVTGAVNLDSFTFDLDYDATAFRINTACDPFSDSFCDFSTGPITLGTFYTDASTFPSLFNPGFILLDGSGNQTGQLLGVNGAWQDFDPAPSGDGILAFIEFLAVDGGSLTSPITVVGQPTSTDPTGTVSEPATTALVFGGAGSLLGLRRRRSARN
jgi:hypothetical protein